MENITTDPPTLPTAEAMAPAEAAEAVGAAEKPAKSEKPGKSEKPPKPPKAEISALVKAAEAYVTELLDRQLPGTLTYHTSRHTAMVAKEARALATAAKLGPDDTEHLLLAAWFHDTGYLDAYDGHEYRSMARAADWLTQQGYPAAGITAVQDLIKATHRNEPETTELEKMLVDADLSNLAQEDFMSRAELLRTEWEAALGKTHSNPAWAEIQLSFMLSHKFQSETGKDRYKEQFKANRKEQRDALKKLEKKAKKKDQEENGTFAEGKRGVETMFRTMYSNHITLSQMADNKANMMVSLNAVILSILITYLGAKSSALGPAFTNNPVLAVPMGLLVLTALGSVTTAILSAQPDVTSFKWLKRSPQVATNRRVNILFFGQFTKLSLDNFQGGMTGLMRDSEALYSNMVTDLYYLGEVLDRKYRLLRTSYSIFMVGLILTALSFGIVLAYKA